MTKALMAIVFALVATNFAVAEESTSNKINDKLNKVGDKFESAVGIDGKKKTKETTENTSNRISDDLDKTGDKIEGAFDKGAVKTKKAARKAKDEVCETVNGKLKCVKQKAKHSVKNAEDKVESEVKK